MRSPRAVSWACAVFSVVTSVGCDNTDKECAQVMQAMPSGILKAPWESQVGRGLKAKESAQIASKIASDVGNEGQALANLKLTHPKLQRYVADYQTFAKEIKTEAERVAAAYSKLADAQAQSQAAEEAYQKSLEAYRQLCPKKTQPDCNALYKAGGPPEGTVTEGYEKKLLFYVQKIEQLPLTDPAIKGPVDTFTKAAKDSVAKLQALATAEGAAAGTDTALAQAVEKSAPVRGRIQQVCKP